ncbi:unnamed protein product [Arabidopsis thaliana]|uniref:(thale cress) hypothetical protein n=1 Tax=Arabidopsis thaliana TaxID=3702 RepID=A0A7G2DWD4_ARATH|nr:unnamed protein product [Arabidopsis thaliana]
MLLKPLVYATNMEPVVTLGEQPELFTGNKIRQTNDTLFVKPWQVHLRLGDHETCRTSECTTNDRRWCNRKGSLSVVVKWVVQKQLSRDKTAKELFLEGLS